MFRLIGGEDDITDEDMDAFFDAMEDELLAPYQWEEYDIYEYFDD